MMLHILIPKKELNYLVRDFGLSKSSAELCIQTEGKKFSLWQCLHHLPQQTLRIHPFFLWREEFYILCRYFAASAKVWSATVPTRKLETSLTGASSHWNMFCCTTGISLPLHTLLTRLHRRRRMKQWSTSWRKLITISMSSWSVLTWIWWTFCWDTNLGSPSTVLSVHVG